MGAAKKRGSFAERQAAAYERIDQASVGMAEHLKQLEVMEEQSERIQLESATKLITAFTERQEQQRKARMGIRIGGENAAS